MTLADLYAQIVPTFSINTQKDLKTAVKMLAQALNYSSPEACPYEAYNLPLPAIYQRLETYLTHEAKGLHTIRNVKNNLSRLFREAEHKDLLSLPPATPVRRFLVNSKTHLPSSERFRQDGTNLPHAYWPASLQTEFAQFTKWATDPIVEGRDQHWRKRLATVELYKKVFVGYFGFLHHIHHIDRLTFNQLFDLSLIRAYVNWHVNEKFQRPTRTIHHFLACLLTLTNQYQPRPKLRQQIKDLQRTLAPWTPTYNKNDSWIPLIQLKQIGEAIWPNKSPRTIHKNGRKHALYAGLSLILQLWVYIPYRQRNMREMSLYTNLYKDHHGAWRIRFTGEQLKVATRRGHLNTFDLPFPEPLVPKLEEYLTVWRPILIGSTTPAPSYVFLNSQGNQFRLDRLLKLTQHTIFAYTGRHWYPHMIRTTWATEYIKQTGDFYGAAIMLNDKLETVIQTYAYLRDENVAEKAYRWVQNHHL
jgi:hypothetical protein